MSHSDTILFINSSPGSDVKTHADREFREIESAYRQSLLRSRFEMKSFWSVRPMDLRQGLLRYSPVVLHISGISNGNGILLEDHYGDPHSISSNTLSKLFGLFEDQLKWVILSGCYDEEQARIISEKIPNVIGLEGNLSPEARIDGVCAIYDSLMIGRNDPVFIAKLALSSVGMISGENVGVHLLQNGEIIDLEDEEAHNQIKTSSDEPKSPLIVSDYVEDIKAFFCDRAIQNQEFIQNFIGTSPFRFFTLHGNTYQSHHGLFNRFYHHYFATPEELDYVSRHKIILKQALSLEGFKAEICSKLILDLRMPSVLQLPDDKQMTGIAKQLNHRNIRTLAVDFRVRSSYWKPFTSELINWFMKEYCQIKDPNMAVPKFYFFVSVIYEENEDHEILLDKIREKVIQMPGTIILSELGPVERNDIEDWIDKFITSTPTRKLRLLKRYFPENLGFYDMELVELRLNAMIEHEKPDNNKT